MPCSALYACCTARRRWVSEMARCMESVIRSAYMITWPSTLRAARPMVWISDVSPRRNPSLSASRMATRDTSGQVEALPQQVDADQDVELAQPQIAEDLNALDGVDVGVQVADPQPHLQQVVGQVLGHLLGERRHQHPVAPLGAVAGSGLIRSSIWPLVGLTITSGSTSPVGRTICSTTWVDCWISYGDGVADRNTHWLTRS